MKLIFTFSMPQEFNPFMNPYSGFTTTVLELPDEALQSPNIQEHVLAIANGVGEITQANLSITCAPLGLKDLTIKDVPFEGIEERTRIEIARLLITYTEAIAIFCDRGGTRQLRIAAPIPSLLPKLKKWKMTKQGRWVEDKRPLSLRQSLYHPDFKRLDQDDPLRQAYFLRFAPLVENVIPLLNTDPHLKNWELEGICPDWYNEAQAMQAEKRYKAAERKAEKEAAKQAKLQAKRKPEKG